MVLNRPLKKDKACSSKESLQHLMLLAISKRSVARILEMENTKNSPMV
jgi:hypothetical protein